MGLHQFKPSQGDSVSGRRRRVRGMGNLKSLLWAPIELVSHLIISSSFLWKNKSAKNNLRKSGLVSYHHCLPPVYTSIFGIIVARITDTLSIIPYRSMQYHHVTYIFTQKHTEICFLQCPQSYRLCF